jgi:hypothetical protein
VELQPTDEFKVKIEIARFTVLRVYFKGHTRIDLPNLRQKAAVRKSMVGANNIFEHAFSQMNSDSPNPREPAYKRKSCFHTRMTAANTITSSAITFW